MHPQIDSIFDDAENRYLKPEELKLVSQYVESLPERLEVYRRLRDQEVEIMQWAADQLQAAMPQEKPEMLERSIKNALLMLRYCAMGMLLNDDSLVKERYVAWIHDMNQVYNTSAIDSALSQYLNQRLNQVLGAKAMSLLRPMIALAQGELAQPESMNGMATIGW
jgi:hypothetical protein